MDSKVVNRQIRAEVRPLLKELGFELHGSELLALLESRIDVINLQSFNDYNASLMGCATYSFAVNLGCYFTDIADRHDAAHPKRDRGETRPAECACPFRGRLRRSFPQAEYDDREIWFIDPAGRYFQKAVRDVRVAIRRDAVPWFDRLADRPRFFTCSSHRMSAWASSGALAAIRAPFVTISPGTSPSS